MKSFSSNPDAADTTTAPTEATRPTNIRVKPFSTDGSKQTARKLWLMKKTVLLIDFDPGTREARSKVMRGMGVTVHCAASMTGARQKLEAGSYDLVLLDLGPDVEAAKSLAQEVKARNSRQLVAFLVGRPLYVSMTLDGSPVASKVRAPRVATVHKSEAPAASVFDFGQKIREAETKRIA